MTRTLRDDELLVWEAYVTSGEWGRPDGAKVVFHCLTEPGRRARALVGDGDLAEAGRELARLSEDDLAGLLRRAEPLS